MVGGKTSREMMERNERAQDEEECVGVSFDRAFAGRRRTMLNNCGV